MTTRVEGSTYTDEPLAFLLEDASITETISPYYMGRIVDFPQFIAAYPFKPDAVDRSWSFNPHRPPAALEPGELPADHLPGRAGRAVPIPGPCPDRVSIQTMTTMLMGYKRPDYLAKIGRLPTSEATIDMLEDAIEQQTPYISDYF